MPPPRREERRTDKKKKVGSSTQGLPHHAKVMDPLASIPRSFIYMESWSAFPAAKARLVRTLRASGKGGIVLLSGDVHFPELSWSPAGCHLSYPLFEVTSSGLTHTSKDEIPGFLIKWLQLLLPTPQRAPAGRKWTELQKNFGTVTIDWDAEPVGLTLQVVNEDGSPAYTQAVTLDQLQAAPYVRACRGWVEEKDLFFLNKYRLFLLSVAVVAGGLYSAWTAVRQVPALLRFALNLATPASKKYL